jgi:hypothetical protein
MMRQTTVIATATPLTCRIFIVSPHPSKTQTKNIAPWRHSGVVVQLPFIFAFCTQGRRRLREGSDQATRIRQSRRDTVRTADSAHSNSWEQKCCRSAKSLQPPQVPVCDARGPEVTEPPDRK